MGQIFNVNAESIIAEMRQDFDTAAGIVSSGFNGQRPALEGGVAGLRGAMLLRPGGGRNLKCGLTRTEKQTHLHSEVAASAVDI